MTKRWWLPNRHSNRTTVRRALAWLDNATETGKTAAVVVDARTHLFESDLEAVLGADQIASLAKKQRIGMKGGGRLQVISMHGNRGPRRWDGNVLVVYAEKRHLDFIDEIEGVAEVLVVPWDSAEIAYWVRQWNATQLGNLPREGVRPALNPVVRHALELVMAMVATNVSVRPKDRGYLMGALLHCLRNDERFTAEEVRAWAATREGCVPRFADGLGEIAADVLAGTNLHLAKQFGKADSIARWRREVGLGERPAGD